jgi:YegS/Rv2252/BmrU family lipid kinase
MTGASRIKLIANPVAGKAARVRIRQATAWFENRGVNVDLTLTGARGDARQAAGAARREGFDRIVAAGGDGTLNEVINGLVPSPIPLAFLPLGTTNVFALEVGIPFSVEAACRIALEGRPTPVALGAADDTRFLLMASAGADAEAVYGVSGRLKRLAGKFAYLASAVGVLLRQPPRPIEAVTADGEIIPCFGAILSNGRLYGGRFLVSPEASLQEPALDVCLLLHPGRLGLLRTAATFAVGRRPDPAAVRSFKTSFLRLQGAPVPVQIDGDFFGRLPVTFRSMAGELQLVLPATLEDQQP